MIDALHRRDVNVARLLESAMKGKAVRTILAVAAIAGPAWSLVPADALAQGWRGVRPAVGPHFGTVPSGVPSGGFSVGPHFGTGTVQPSFSNRPAWVTSRPWLRSGR